jgi:thiamine-monophosphate kinase
MLGERAIIALLSKHLSPADDIVVVPAGDDCAVARAPLALTFQVLTTDLLIEGTHFLNRSDTDWFALGRRAMVANISDLASMGAKPQAILSSIGLPPGFPVARLDALYAGMAHECSLWGARLVGGDTARSSNVVINITATGNKSPNDASCLRSNCRPGQNLFVSGALGGTRAGLELLSSPAANPARQQPFAADLIHRQQVPTPRVPLGRYLATHIPDVAVIDISDSLYNELHLLAEASSVGFDIHLPSVPLFPGVQEHCQQINRDPVTFALGSGEEYELLFTCNADPDQLIATASQHGNVPVTCIGTVQPGNTVRFLDAKSQPVQITDETFRHYSA